MLIVDTMNLEDHVAVPESCLGDIEGLLAATAGVHAGTIGDVAVSDREWKVVDQVVDDMLLRIEEGFETIRSRLAIDDDANDFFVVTQPSRVGRDCRRFNDAGKIDLPPARERLSLNELALVLVDLNQIRSSP